MAKESPAFDRTVRLERLRARAALERAALSQSIEQAAHDWQPGNLLKNMLSRLTSRQASYMACEAFSLLRRYPVVTSSLSALVMGKGRRFRLLRLAGGAFLLWQIFNVWRASRRD